MNKVETINNFKIIFNHDKNAKICKIDSYINNGMIYENKNNCGISHLVEHIVIDGWSKCGSSCNEYWKKKGVELNAETSQTYINYYISGLSKYLYEMLEYIISISLNPIVTKNRINKEKKAVNNELLIQSSDTKIKLYDNLNKILFNIDGLKYQDDMKLQIKNLDHIKFNDIKQWIKQFYNKGNVIFIISGYFPYQETINFLKDKLNSINNFYQNKPELNIFSPGFKIKFVKTNVYDNTTIFFTFPNSFSYRDEDFAYFELFKKFIDSNTSSKLMTVLREKKKLIYNIYIDEYVSKFGNYFIIDISTKNKNTKKVITNTIDILKQLSNGIFTDEELTYAKESFMVKYYNTCQNAEFTSSILGEQYINQINEKNQTILTYENVLSKIKKVDKPTFINFIKKLLTFGNLKIVYQSKEQIPNLQSLVRQRI